MFVCVFLRLFRSSGAAVSRAFASALKLVEYLLIAVVCRAFSLGFEVHCSTSSSGCFGGRLIRLDMPPLPSWVVGTISAGTKRRWLFSLHLIVFPFLDL